MKKFNIIFYIFVILIVVLGIFLRLKIYLFKIPFWIDEIVLSQSFIDEKFLNFFHVLVDNQKAPPLFCSLVLIVQKIFGYNEYSLRLIPLLSGILSLFAFYFLLNDYIKSKLVLLTGLFLFAVNPVLIYYSAEFKPYSSDVLICILLLFSYKYMNLKNIQPFKSIWAKVIVYLIISNIIILFSFPSILIIPSMMIAKFIEEKKITFPGVMIFLGSFTSSLYLYFVYKDLRVTEILENDWQTGFIKPSATSLYTTFKDFYLFVIQPEGGITALYIKLTFLLILLGLLYLIIEKRNTIFYIILIAVILAASYLKIYPLTGRIILYLIPLFIMFIIKSADNPVFIKKIPLIIFNVLKVFLLFIILFCIFEIKFDEKFNYYKIINMSVDERNNIKNVTVDIFNNCSDNDKFLFNYIYYDSFNFYKKMYKFNKTVDWEVEIYINSKEQWEKSFTDFFNNQSLNYKYWITFENSYDNKEKIYAKEFFKQKLKEKNITFKEFHYGLYYAWQLNSIN